MNNESGLDRAEESRRIIVEPGAPSPLVNALRSIGAAKLGFANSQTPSVLPVRGLPLDWHIHHFPARLTNSLLTSRLPYLLKAGGLVLVDGSSEGLIHSDRAMRTFYDILGTFGVDVSRVVLVHANRKFPTRHSAWCDSLGCPAVQDLEYNSLYRQVGRNAANLPKSRPETLERSLVRLRTKHFLCLNHRARPHRVGLLLHLLRSDDFSKGYVSLLEPRISFDPKAIPWYPQPDELCSHVEALTKTLPLRVDAVDRYPSGLVGLGDFMPYTDSYFSIVTETDFLEGDEMDRITEKIFKPIAGMHPFLAFAASGALKRLHELGFQTFHPVIDESYDVEDKREIRAQKLFAEIRRMCNLSLRNLHDVYVTLWPRLVHNYRHLTNCFTRDTRQEDIAVNQLIEKWELY